MARTLPALACVPSHPAPTWVCLPLGYSPIPSPPTRPSPAGNRLWEWFSVGRWGTAGYDVKSDTFRGEEWPAELGALCAPWGVLWAGAGVGRSAGRAAAALPRTPQHCPALPGCCPALLPGAARPGPRARSTWRCPCPACRLPPPARQARTSRPLPWASRPRWAEKNGRLRAPGWRSLPTAAARRPAWARARPLHRRGPAGKSTRRTLPATPLFPHPCTLRHHRPPRLSHHKQVHGVAVRILKALFIGLGWDPSRIDEVGCGDGAGRQGEAGASWRGAAAPRRSPFAAPPVAVHVHAPFRCLPTPLHPDLYPARRRCAAAAALCAGPREEPVLPVRGVAGSVGIEGGPDQGGPGPQPLGRALAST